VRTTGATLASAAEALRGAGAPEIVTLALAVAAR
jgi:predicted amidophosphoribosyltransferase